MAEVPRTAAQCTPTRKNGEQTLYRSGSDGVYTPPLSQVKQLIPTCT